MKKMLIENIKAILGGMLAIIALIAGSYSGGVITSVKNGDISFGAIPGTDLPSPYCQNGLCKAVVSGTCENATTTLAVITNPFLNATSSATRAIVEITSVATTTANITLATSSLIRFAPVSVSSRYATSTSLINAAPIFNHATGLGTTTIISGVALVDGAWNTATTVLQIPSQQQVLVGPGSATTTSNSNLVLWAGDYGGVGSTAGITGLSNNFACKYSVEFEAVAR